MKLVNQLVSLISKHKPLKATLALAGFLFTTATFSVASTVLTATKASAELITSRGFGVSLNTNNNKYQEIIHNGFQPIYFRHTHNLVNFLRFVNQNLDGCLNTEVQENASTPTTNILVLNPSYGLVTLLTWIKTGKCLIKEMVTYSIDSKTLDYASQQTCQ
jgi:hypothetical protein